MTAYTMSTQVPLPYDEAVAAVRDALAEQGFGVLTEIDLAAVLKAKLDVEVTPQIILGACRPPLAHQAIQADPSIAALLPCNVVVRSRDASSSVVEAFDPEFMLGFADSAALADVARDARARLSAALGRLTDPGKED